MRISDWSSDVCSSDLVSRSGGQAAAWTRRRSSTWSSLRRQDRRVTETADRGLDVLGADQSVERQAGCVRDHRLEAQLANRMGSSGAPVARRQALQQLLVERERLDGGALRQATSEASYGLGWRSFTYGGRRRSAEHTSEPQSQMRNSYAV